MASSWAGQPSRLDILLQTVREPLRLLSLAIVTGLVGGAGAVAFRLMIAGATWAFTRVFGRPEGGHVLAALAPAAGIVLVGLITTYVAREVKGHEVPQILESLALRGGRIRPRVGFFGILAPAITIGSGGSVGRKGPIALIGASFGSLLGQVLHLDEQDLSLPMACGASAGIGAAFNAPIAGALFGTEVILASYAMNVLVPCVVSSVTGVLLFARIMGPSLSLPILAYALHPLGMVLMLLLGLLAGGFGLLYTRGLQLSEDAFAGLPGPFWVKNLVGGLLVGILGLLFPQVLRVGYGTMRLTALGGIPAALALLLLVMKYLATVITIGAGGSGGVFAPSLYLGPCWAPASATRCTPSFLTSPPCRPPSGWPAWGPCSPRPPRRPSRPSSSCRR